MQYKLLRPACQPDVLSRRLSHLALPIPFTSEATLRLRCHYDYTCMMLSPAYGTGY